MKFALLFCSVVLLTGLAAAEPAKKEVKPLNLPVIEVNSETPQSKPAAANIIYELPPIRGEKATKMSGNGVNSWGGPFGRAWPGQTAPGTPGAQGGGPIVNPGGFPGRF